MKLAVGTEKEFFSTLHGIAYLAKQVDRESALPLSPTVTFAFSIKDDDDENATHEFQECPEDLRAIFEAVLQAFGPRMLDYEYAEIISSRAARHKTLPARDVCPLWYRRRSHKRDVSTGCSLKGP
jgi:hypothetical protein